MNNIDNTDNVVVPREELQNILDYLYELEQNSYFEFVGSGGNPDNHIFSSVMTIQDCVFSQ